MHSQTCLRNKIVTNTALLRDSAKHCANTTQEQAGVRTEADRPKSLLLPFEDVLRARRDYATMFSAAADCVFDREQFGSYSGAFPMASVTRSGGVIGGTDKNQATAVDGAKLADISSGGNRFDHRHQQHVLICITGVFE